MRIEWSDDLVVKVAEGSDDARRLSREEAVLRAVAHPAIVRVAGSEDGVAAGDGAASLSLHRVTGTSLAEAPGQPEEVIAGWGAAVATVVADLHDLGYVHNAIAAEHVLVDEHGRPILCGFGRAGRVLDVGADAMGDDVRAVARLIEQLLPPGGGRLGRTVRRWSDGRPRRRAGARALAQAIVDQVPGAVVRPVRPGGGPLEDKPPGGSGDAPSADATGGGSGYRPPAVVAGAVVIGAVVCAVAWWGLADPGHSRRTSPTPSPDTGVSAYLLRSVPGGDPITVVGHWDCGPARPAVLDTRSGSIWTFPAWPTRGGSVTGTLLRRVAGASGLAAVSSAGAPAGAQTCDRLLVLRPGKPDLAVPVGPGGG